MTSRTAITALVAVLSIVLVGCDRRTGVAREYVVEHGAVAADGADRAPKVPSADELDAWEITSGIDVFVQDGVAPKSDSQVQFKGAPGCHPGKGSGGPEDGNHGWVDAGGNNCAGLDVITVYFNDGEPVGAVYSRAALGGVT